MPNLIFLHKMFNEDKMFHTSEADSVSCHTWLVQQNFSFGSKFNLGYFIRHHDCKNYWFFEWLGRFLLCCHSPGPDIQHKLQMDAWSSNLATLLMPNFTWLTTTTGCQGHIHLLFSALSFSSSLVSIVCIVPNKQVKLTVKDNFIVCMLNNGTYNNSYEHEAKLKQLDWQGAIYVVEICDCTIHVRWQMASMQFDYNRNVITI